jgi:hypothetical protein
MTALSLVTIRCPLCDSCDVHHDVRASLIYRCQDCLHEWQIDPADEPSDAEPGMRESLRAAAARVRGRLRDGLPRR